MDLVDESEPNRGRQFPSTLTNVIDGVTASHRIGCGAWNLKFRRKELSEPARHACRFSYAGDVANRLELLCA
ncbi:hypothetical protein BZM27_27300 [Paraburkholderia steynii]|uniref:Uncharacterized protein n=1 Tax=Paraburkholderia steynii TaxID=1245441 RepID=A0A4R0XCA8_9BURK|nr:hypothetical protein BZM27_27300 [Paraburkholderia steynii]